MKVLLRSSDDLPSLNGLTFCAAYGLRKLSGGATVVARSRVACENRGLGIISRLATDYPVNEDADASLLLGFIASIYSRSLFVSSLVSLLALSISLWRTLSCRSLI